jgi:hypothetical protein
LAGRGPAPCARPLPELLLLDEPVKLPQGLVHVPAHGGCRDPLGQPAAQARAGHDVGEAELDAPPAAGSLAQPPPAAVVETGDRRPGEVARLVELDDLDQSAELGCADPKAFGSGRL